VAIVGGVDVPGLAVERVPEPQVGHLFRSTRGKQRSGVPKACNKFASK
jgi:hypothetical protein